MAVGLIESDDSQSQNDLMSEATKTAGPLKPITAGQIRALFAIGKRRGLSHEQLREAGGVESLKELSVSAASKLIDRLQCSDHRTAWQPPPPDRAKRGCIRNATERQRNYIQVLLDELGWDADKSRAWLQKRHGIHDLAGGVFLASTAKDAILQLQEAMKKR